jgi:hypothetical protein
MVWELGLEPKCSASQFSTFPIPHTVLFLFFYFWGSTGVWTSTCYAGTLPLQPLPQPFFVLGFFQDKVLQTICLGWLWTVILLISASWVVRITGGSHLCLAMYSFFETGSHLCSPDLPKTLDLLIPLPQSPEYWDYRHVPPCPVCLTLLRAVKKTASKKKRAVNFIRWHFGISVPA